MNIGILIICTGKYSVFFETLYKSCEEHFLPEHNKKYYVFTDDDKIVSKDNIIKIEQERLGWPYDTLKRFSIFNKIKETLLKEDYLFFLNANMLCLNNVGDDILPDEENNYLMAVQHPGFYKKSNILFTYERNPVSNFYIPFGEGEFYCQGCFIGGRSLEFIDMSEKLDKLIDDDLSKGIIPIWWDESALNWYFLDKNPLVVDQHYAYPENHRYDLSLKRENAIILNRDKSNFGGHDFLRNKNNN